VSASAFCPTNGSHLRTHQSGGTEAGESGSSHRDEGTRPNRDPVVAGEWARRPTDSVAAVRREPRRRRAMPPRGAVLSPGVARCRRRGRSTGLLSAAPGAVGANPRFARRAGFAVASPGGAGGERSRSRDPGAGRRVRRAPARPAAPTRRAARPSVPVMRSARAPRGHSLPTAPRGERCVSALFH